ncbi:LysE family translocator [Metabacillus dongyingensis]|uniref:LysE family translocator n=1 Tax=Metabacillus dongyingensis TaxID=2874282 RepID=UPI003B8CDE78
MEVIVVLSFLGTAIFLTLMPGPDILFVIAQSISQNKKAGIATALGLCSGLVIHISAATLGISAVIYQSSLAFAIVKYAGSAYLLFLAWQSFRVRESDFAIGKQHSLNYKSLYKKGILMNILNPKVSLFFLALLPQFVDRTMGHASIQMLILGIIFMVQALIIFIAVSVFSDKIRDLLIRKTFIAKRMNVIKGSLLGFIGLQIALSEK